jgi:phage N-6-adenine-methyltransferase
VALVEATFGYQFELDACANAVNAVAPKYYDLETNGLEHPWRDATWCNPPFENIEPWVEKAVGEATRGVHSCMLVPFAAQGWKYRWHGNFESVVLVGRVTFVGATTCINRDIALLRFGPEAELGCAGPGIRPATEWYWRWRTNPAFSDC